MCCGCACLCGDVEEEVKRWSGGEKSGGAWAHGWHLGRVLKVGISGPAQRRQKCLPIDAAGERERENSRDVARRVEANIRKYVYTSGEGLIVFARYEYREGVRNARERERERISLFSSCSSLTTALLRDFHAQGPRRPTFSQANMSSRSRQNVAGDPLAVEDQGRQTSAVH